MWPHLLLNPEGSHTMTTLPHIAPGAICEHTLRPDHILAALADEYRRILPDEHHLPAAADRLIARPFPLVLDWDDETYEEAMDLVLAMEARLSLAAQERGLNLDIGTHPYDGACYGWWPNFDNDDDAAEA